jgi:tRNA 2-thiouridine synthesizing protein E
MSLERDGDGFLLAMSDWSVDVMHETAREDDKTLTEEQVSHIMLAREMYEETSMVPRVKDFGKALGMDRKAKGLYDEWKTGPMKQIAKYGGLPKPTGCV